MSRSYCLEERKIELNCGGVDGESSRSSVSIESFMENFHFSSRSPWSRHLISDNLVDNTLININCFLFSDQNRNYDGDMFIARRIANKLNESRLRHHANAWRWFWATSCLHSSGCSVRARHPRASWEDSAEKLGSESFARAVHAQSTGKFSCEHVTLCTYQFVSGRRCLEHRRDTEGHTLRSIWRPQNTKLSKWQIVLEIFLAGEFYTFISLLLELSPII